MQKKTESWIGYGETVKKLLFFENVKTLSEKLFYFLIIVKDCMNFHGLLDLTLYGGRGHTQVFGFFFSFLFPLFYFNFLNLKSLCNVFVILLVVIVHVEHHYFYTGCKDLDFRHGSVFAWCTGCGSGTKPNADYMTAPCELQTTWLVLVNL